MVWQFLKKLNIELSYVPEYLLLGIYTHKKIENEDSKQYVYMHIHSSIIQNNPKVEAVRYPSTDK